MAPRGGHRSNAGRPKKYANEPTQAIRLPLSFIEQIKKGAINLNPQTIPLYSSNVRAGSPTPASDDIECYLNLNDYCIKHPESTFLVRAAGDSMTDAGIESGDLLIVDRSLEPVTGKIVIAAIDGELTVKRLSVTKAGVQLLPENKAYAPIDITDNQQIIIWGVVIFILHQA